MRQEKNHRGGLIFNISSLAGVIQLLEARFPLSHCFKSPGTLTSESRISLVHHSWISQCFYDIPISSIREKDADSEVLVSRYVPFQITYTTTLANSPPKAGPSLWPEKCIRIGTVSL